MKILVDILAWIAVIVLGLIICLGTLFIILETIRTWPEARPGIIITMILICGFAGLLYLLLK